MHPRFDVFVENYGPGVIERLNIGYDVLKEANPGIIYVRIKGFGASGPYSGYRCMDMVAQAAAGAFSVTGEADGPPMMPGTTTGDSGTGVQAAMAILAACIQKQRTGIGQEVELSMHGGGNLLRAHPHLPGRRVGQAPDAAHRQTPGACRR